MYKTLWNASSHRKFHTFLWSKILNSWQNIINGIFLFSIQQSEESERADKAWESPSLLERLSEQSETPLVRFIKYSFMVMIMNNKSHQQTSHFIHLAQQKEKGEGVVDIEFRLVDDK